MFFGKRKKNVEILKLEIDVLWKSFLSLNGIFILGLTQVVKIDYIKSFGDILMITLAVIYFFGIVGILKEMTKAYKELFTILEK